MFNGLRVVVASLSVTCLLLLVAALPVRAQQHPASLSGKAAGPGVGGSDARSAFTLEGVHRFGIDGAGARERVSGPGRAAASRLDAKYGVLRPSDLPVRRTEAGDASVAATSYFEVSDDGGVFDGWSNEFSPTMIGDVGGNLWAAFVSDSITIDEEGTWRPGIWLSKSIDGGATWEAQMFVYPLSEGRSFSKPQLAYGDGHVFVSYLTTDGTVELFRASAADPFSDFAFFAVPLPDGAGTPIDVRVETDSEDFEGEVWLYLTYLFATDTGATLYFASSREAGDLGAGWEELVDLGPADAPSEATYFDHGFAYGGGVLYVGYVLDGDIVWRLSGDLGTSFSDTSVLFEGDGTWRSALDVAATGERFLLTYTHEYESGDDVLDEVVGVYSDSFSDALDLTLIEETSEGRHPGLADATHDAAGNFLVNYLSMDFEAGVSDAVLQYGLGTAAVSSTPILLSTPTSEGTVFGPEQARYVAPAVAGLGTGAGGAAGYTASPWGDSGIYGNSIAVRSAADIAVSPQSLTLYEDDAAPASGAARPAPDLSHDHVPGELVVGFANALDVDAAATTSSTGLNAALRRLGAASMQPLVRDRAARSASPLRSGLASTYVVTLSGPADLASAIRTLEADPNVRYAEPNYVMRAVGYPQPSGAPVAPSDPLFASQWGLENTGQAMPHGGGTAVGTAGVDVNAPSTWDLTLGEPGVVVAVLDEGVDPTHSEFAGRLLPGYDFINDVPNATPLPPDAHGTASAGIVAAAHDATGVAGVAPNVKILPGKVLEDGSGSNASVTAGIVWAADQGAEIISMSLGGGSFSTAMNEAVDYATASGALVLSAAGNGNSDNRTTPHYPAGYANSMSIGALSPCGERKRSSDDPSEVNPGILPDPSGVTCDNEFWWGSNYGDLDGLAPGTRIHTTDNSGGDGYDPSDYVATFNGTSSATPFAAGIAALIRSANPDLTPVQVRSFMNLTAVDVEAPGYDEDAGFGRFDAYAAVTAALSASPAELDLYVYNYGVLDLEVASIASASPWLTATPSSFSVAPGEVTTIDVAVDWSDAGFGDGSTQEGVLEILSNDPDEPSIVVGVTAVPSGAVTAPSIEVDPSSFSFVIEQGSSASGELTITNTGGVDLLWTIGDQVDSESRLLNAPRTFDYVVGEPVAEKASNRLEGAASGRLTRFTASADGAASSVLYFSDIDAAADRAAERALALLDVGLTAYVDDYAGFLQALSEGGWDLVVYESAARYRDHTALIDYVEAGGKLITSYWDYDADLDLVAAMDAVYVSSIDPPMDVYRWETHPLFSAPKAVPDTLMVRRDDYIDNGDRFEPAAGATAVAGFAASATATDAAIIVGNEGRTILNGMLFADFLAEPGAGGDDRDGDGVVDIVELVVNQVSFLLDGVSEMDWLSVAPTAGTVAPGSTGVVQLSASTAGLAVGSYQVSLAIESNDPAQPVVDVPVSLTVTDPGPGGCDWTWSAGLAVGEFEGRVDTLYFGQAEGATSGIDADCGEVEQPPVPVAGVFDARFGVEGTAGTLLDVRAYPADSALWTVQFQPSDEGGYPFTFNWDPLALPAGRFLLTGIDGEGPFSINMKDTSAFSVLDADHVFVEYRNELCLPVELADTWNLVSVPITAADMRPSVLFPDAPGSAFAYTSGDGYVATDPLAAGEGYWLKNSVTGTYEICGVGAGPDVPVEEGWNLVGFFDAATPTASITSEPEGLVTSLFFGFTPRVGYDAASSVEAGQGYWVKTSGAGVLTTGEAVPSSAKRGEPLVALHERMDAWLQLQVQDENGSSRTLYLSREADQEALFDLPPAPPDDLFDVRFATDRLTASMEARAAEIVLRGTAGAVRVTALNLGTSVLHLQDVFDGSLLDVRLREGETATLAAGLDRVRVQALALPVEFALEQNYPNPFNPSTTIRYALPEEVEVELAVFDMLGRRVQVLASGRQEAGHHEVSVEARELASGVYFYTLRAGDHLSTRRMILVK